MYKIFDNERNKKMAINLKAKPFYLSDEDIKWVEETLANLTLDEKIGQVFVDMLWNNTEEEVVERIQKYGMGGFRYNNMSPADLYKQNKVIQETSKIPALIAANIEAGGDGGVGGGTHFGHHVTIGATQDKENAYKLGYYGCKEAAAIGCNWTFAPIVDINKNWRNCVVSSRCFSSEAEQVLDMSKEYLRGAKDAGLASCMKHFPGDGLDERDQHIVTTNNDMSVEEWEENFGKVYRGMIDAGVESVMIGHIRLPEMSRKLRPGIKDNEIMPATIAPELLQDLLRDELGFNGLVITDATHMVGLTSAMRRPKQTPQRGAHSGTKGSYRLMSRWVSSTRYPFCRMNSVKAWATATERWCPPVQPTAMTREDFPSSTYWGSRKAKSSSRCRINSVVCR